MDQPSPTFEYTIILVLNHTNLTPKPRSTLGDWGSVAGLLFISLPSSVLNGILLGTIGSSSTLKKIPFNLIILALSCVHLIDSSINAAVSLSFAVHSPLSPVGSCGCGVVAGLHYSVISLVFLSVCHLLIDRVYAVRRTTSYKNKVSKCRQITVILNVWILAILTALPIYMAQVVNFIDVRPFPSRLTCAIAKSNFTEASFFITYGSVNYFIPVCVSILCSIYLLLILFKDWRVSKSSVHDLTDNVLRQPLLWSELQLTRVALVIVLLYFVLFLPGVINEFDDALHTFHPFLKIPAKNSTTNSTENFTIRPEVMDSSPVDSVFVWFRCLGDLLYPIVIFYLRQDIKNKARILITFWKPHAETSPRPSAYVTRREESNVTKRKRKKETKAHFSTPVLFATSEGLYLRVTEENLKRENRGQSGGGFRFWTESGGRGQWSAESGQPQFVCHVCDVSDSFDYIEDLEEREIEPSPTIAESRSVSRSSLYRKSPFSDAADPSDADSGVGGDSEEESSQSARERVVRFAEGASTIPSTSDVGLEDNSMSEWEPPIRPTSMRLPPISESDMEEAKPRLYIKNSRGGKGRSKIDGHKPEWNVSTRTRALDSWNPMPTWSKSKRKNQRGRLKRGIID